MFIDDMGGHERALEALGDVLNGRDLNEVNFTDVINDVRTTLTNHYSGWLCETDYLRPMLRIILSHKRVSKGETIVGLNGKEVEVDQLMQYGLIRFESSDPDQTVGYLSCPYVWLWIMAHENHGYANDSLLRNWDFGYYKDVLSWRI